MARSGTGRKGDSGSGGDKVLIFPVDIINEDSVQSQIRDKELSVPLPRKMRVRHRLPVRPGTMSFILNFTGETKTAVLQDAEDRYVSLPVACTENQIFPLGDRDMAGADPVRVKSGELPRTLLPYEKRDDRASPVCPLKGVKDRVLTLFQDSQICGGREAADP